MRRKCPHTEKFKFVVGCSILACFGPYTALQVAMCQAWEFIDEKVFGFVAAIKRWNASVAPSLTFCMKYKEDGFVPPILLWLGVVQPAWFFYEFWYAVNYGVVWYRIIFYNIVRIGPAYANFMYVYVLAHKEAHGSGSLFKKPYHYFLKYVFNHWVGLFHGVMPGNFTCAHVYNHHKYDNAAPDVVSTAFRPRNSFKNWVAYLYDWFSYATNATIVLAFIDDGNTKMVWQTILSSRKTFRKYFLCFFFVFLRNFIFFVFQVRFGIILSLRLPIPSSRLSRC